MTEEQKGIEANPTDSQDPLVQKQHGELTQEIIRTRQNIADLNARLRVLETNCFGEEVEE